MKKTLTTLGMGACVLLAFSSCQSTDGDGYYSSEEALPMSEMTVADGEIPPWLLEDNSGMQVDAGETTHNPNTFPIPEPEELIAERGGSASSKQNQPNLAANSDVEIETNPADIVVDPGETHAAPPVIAPATTPAKPKPETQRAVTTTRKPGSSTKKPGSKTTTSQKTGKRVTEPTLVTYKVKKGDNLSEIARRSGTTVAAIRKASGIKGDTIYAGSTIKVPYTPKGYKAGKESTAKSTTYTVKKGDTLSGIAAKNGVSLQALLKANNMSSKQASSIRAGQKLTIPAKAGSKNKKGSKGKTSKKKNSRRR